jgi:MoaA/NifB/PqqE/SkfB family radical SAM enzyme
MCGTRAQRRKAELTGQYSEVEEAKRELPEKVLLAYVSQAVGLGASQFLITGGGEPFVRKATTLRLMRHIKKLGAFGNVNTNGSLLTSADARAIVRLGWDMMMFSIDGPTSQTHDSVRGVTGTYEKVRNVLLALKEQKRRLGRDKPKIVFNTVVLNKNWHQLVQLVKFASQVGCESITFIPLIVFDDQVRRFELGQSEKAAFRNVVAEVKEVAQRLGVHTNIHELAELTVQTDQMDELIRKDIAMLPAGRFASLPCFEPFLHLLLTPDGKATCCCMLAGLNAVSLASAGLQAREWLFKNLADVWFGRWFTSLRRQLLRQQLPKECGTCVFSQFLRNRQLRQELGRLGI